MFRLIVLYFVEALNQGQQSSFGRHDVDWKTRSVASHRSAQERKNHDSDREERPRGEERDPCPCAWWLEDTALRASARGVGMLRMASDHHCLRL